MEAGAIPDTGRLTLLCHAPTAATRAATFPLDEPLDPRGRAAATALGGSLKGVGRVLASPARRALETATAMGLSARPEAALRDVDHGRWNGRSLADIAAAEPEAIGLWLADPGAAPHGGEPITHLIDRIATWMDCGAIKGRILAITHTAVIRAAVVHALGAPATSFWRIDAGPLTRVELRRNGARWALQARV